MISSLSGDARGESGFEGEGEGEGSHTVLRLEREGLSSLSLREERALSFFLGWRGTSMTDQTDRERGRDRQAGDRQLGTQADKTSTISSSRPSQWDDADQE